MSEKHEKSEQIEEPITKSNGVEHNVDNNFHSVDSPLKTATVDELNRLGCNGPWLWKLFIICFIPNILNGFHVASYVFLSPMPNRYWCVPPELTSNQWNPENIRTISLTNTSEARTCDIRNLNYTKINEMSYEEALNYTKSLNTKDVIACPLKPHSSNYFYEQSEDASIVPEWDLVCENKAWRSTVQVALSLGKFVGASLFGVISDRYGRKTSYVLGSTLYIVSGMLTTFSPWYWLFMIGRVGLGASGAAVFYASYTLLSENVHAKHRSWMCLAHSISYPVGMVILAYFAHTIHTWRHLSLALSLPAFILFVLCYFIHESPRWLISKGREEEAYKYLFNKAPDAELIAKSEPYKKVKIIEEDEEEPSFKEKLKGALNELVLLYGPTKVRNRVLICHFNWLVISMSYYITALNADNFAVNRVLFTAIMGLVDTPGYITSILCCRYMGRKIVCCLLFLIAGISLLIILAIPQSSIVMLFIFSMLGRFGISSVYAVMTLHTSEMFPTDIRSTALGTSSTCAHVGSISAPYIVDLLGLIAWFIPTTICGVSIMIACLLTLLLPETKNRELKDHVTEEVQEKLVEAPLEIKK